MRSTSGQKDLAEPLLPGRKAWCNMNGGGPRSSRMRPRRAGGAAATTGATPRPSNGSLAHSRTGLFTPNLRPDVTVGVDGPGGLVRGRQVCDEPRGDERTPGGPRDDRSPVLSAPG